MDNSDLMGELIIREYVGGVDDGEREIVPPDGTKHIRRTSGKVFAGGDETPDEIYVYSHEETRTMRVTIWFYANRSEGGSTSSD